MDKFEISQIVFLLKHEDEHIRNNAFIILLNSELDIPDLLPLLQDKTTSIYATIALIIRKEAAIPYLLPFSKEKDKNIRDSAAMVLGKIGEVAIPHLLTLLKDTDNNFSDFVVSAFFMMKDEIAISHLLPLLKDTDDNFSTMAVQVLGLMGEKAIPHLLPLLRDTDDNVRNQAGITLLTMGEVAYPHLVHLLKEGNKTAILLIFNFLGEAFIPYLMPLLQDPDSSVRANAANALENIRKKKEDSNINSTTKDTGIYLGIDFGTTFSSAAILINGEIKRVKEPSKLGYSFPSTIFVDKQGKVFVGQVAENQRFQDPSSYIQEFKKELGKTMSSTWGIRKFLPEDLVSEMFKVLKQEAEKMVNQPIDSVIATIPASYTGYRSELMEKAARDAGFKQVQLLPEPVAAAIYYDHPSSGGKPLADGEILLVYDLGGGTFDAALLQKRGNGYQMLAQPVGDENLGGSNFDWAMYQDLQAQCSDTLRQSLNPRAQEERAMKIRLRVKDWLREFKHQLSSVEQHTDELPIGDFESYTLTRQRFEEMIHPQIQTTCGLCNQLVTSAGLRWEQVGKILLVGGSCRIPYVQRLLHDQFKRPVEWVDELELAVCLGAAIYREVEQNKG
jgi:actin-like ATPase involved in cell morphogenesis